MKEHALRIACYVMCLSLMLCLTGCADGETVAEQVRTVMLEQEEFTPEQTDSEKQEIPDLLYRDGTGYAYQSLNSMEALWYDEMAECMAGIRDEVTLDESGIEQGLDESDVDRIFQCVLMDHPELFYVDGYSYTKYERRDIVVGIRFSPTYFLEKEQILARKVQIEEEAGKLLEQATGLTDDYEKVKYVYETLIHNTEYDLSSQDNQNIYSVFVNHVSVCQGYAKAMQYLLERLGVECTLVQGSVDTGEGHAWNLVKVNGSFYYVDATWGDASYLPTQEEQESGYVPRVSYDYLCVTTEQLLQTHMLGGIVELPVCVEERDNYYVRENALFMTYDREQMQALFDRKRESGGTEVALKCADRECYRKIWNAMIENQEIFNYVSDVNTSVHYVNNEKQLSMTFWVTNQ